jgi:hypothetical protein
MPRGYPCGRSRWRNRPLQVPGISHRPAPPDCSLRRGAPAPCGFRNYRGSRLSFPRFREWTGNSSLPGRTRRPRGCPTRVERSRCCRRGTRAIERPPRHEPGIRTGGQNGDPHPVSPFRGRSLRSAGSRRVLPMRPVALHRAGPSPSRARPAGPSAQGGCRRERRNGTPISFRRASRVPSGQTGPSRRSARSPGRSGRGGRGRWNGRRRSARRRRN